MRKSGIPLTVILMLSVVFMWSLPVFAATDGIYQSSETTTAWDGTYANRLRAPTADYDYAYGDESSVSYTLPWAFTFYGQSYTSINADTNGNIWFGATGSAHSINLASSGRGPVISAWNNDLSCQFYGGVFVQHKTGPERVVVEWQTETYTDEGSWRMNDFEAVLYPSGAIRFDYRSFNPSTQNDFGSGISASDGAHFINLTSEFGNVTNLAGRSFTFAAPAWNDITAQTSVTRSNAMADRINLCQFVLLNVTNTRTVNLSGPVRMVITNPSRPVLTIAGVGLTPDGYTAANEPYFNIVPQGGTLAAGASTGNLRVNFEIQRKPLTYGVRIEQYGMP